MQQAEFKFGSDSSLLPLQGAEISTDKLYRYQLWRTPSRDLPGQVVWVMLNPSTADALHNDATIIRCMEFTRRWGHGRMLVINLFAFRSTDPKGLRSAKDPIGPLNVTRFYEAIDSKPELIVAAWGGNIPPGHDVHVNAIKTVLRSNNAQCLAHTHDGEPKHPVRLPYAMNLRPL